MGTYRSVQTFDLHALRYRMLARGEVDLRGGAANLVRGRFGMKLRRERPELYRRLFAPRAAQSPSGLHDSPRPFVLRVREIEGRKLEPGQEFELGLNLFDTQDAPIDAIGQALAEGIGAECIAVDGREPLRLSLNPGEEAVRGVRVRFLTPTELKPAGPPEFATLLARIRDRISTLRELYGEGRLQIDFREMGQRAAAVRTTQCELQPVAVERVSRNTGQRHSIGGFIGVAEYEGDLTEFVPYLEIARWTGVGRQTVWGKGEIGFETI